MRPRRAVLDAIATSLVAACAVAGAGDGNRHREPPKAASA
jgi:hypothetical protein